MKTLFTLRAWPFALCSLLFALGASAAGFGQSLAFKANAGKRPVASGGFDPSSVAGLQVDINPDEIAGADGDPVSTYTEESANAYVFAQAVALNRPKINTNVKNGHRALFFIGGTNGLVSTITSLSQSNLIIVVYCPTNNVTDEQTLWRADTISQRLKLDTSSLQAYAGATISATSPTVNNWIIAEFLVNGSSSTLTTNGVLAASGDAGAQDLGTFASVGSSYSATTGLNGYIARVLIYRYTPSAAEILYLRNGLNTLYAIY